MSTNQIAELYQSGMSLRAVGAATGLMHEGVRQALLAAGVETRRTGPQHGAQPGPYARDEMPMAPSPLDHARHVDAVMAQGGFPRAEVVKFKTVKPKTIWVGPNGKPWKFGRRVR